MAGLRGIMLGLRGIHLPWERLLVPPAVGQDQDQRLHSLLTPMEQLVVLDRVEILIFMEERETLPSNHFSQRLFNLFAAGTVGIPFLVLAELDKQLQVGKVLLGM